MDVDDPAEAARERERKSEYRRELLERFFRACRDVCRDLGYDRVANELEADWGDIGRHVSSGVLKMCLAPNGERNYFRWEWGTFFTEHSEEAADIYAEIAGRKAKKKPEDELRDLQAIVRAELPKQADKLIRKAATP